MRGWWVTTHCGREYTVAVSAAKAVANVKFRYRRMGYHGPYENWEVKEA